MFGTFYQTHTFFKIPFPCTLPISPLSKTKDKPKKNQEQKVRFIKITVLFTFLCSTERRPRERRENSERTPN